MITLKGLEFVPFISEQEINRAVQQVAERIFMDFSDQTPLFVGVLNGSYMFVADLMKRYKGICEVDFIKVKSYEGTASLGKVREVFGLENFNGNPVIIIEDIVDTGNTIEAILQDFSRKGITNYKIASLFLKPEAYKKPHKIDYVGMEIPNKFIVGHGLDYEGLGRNLPEVYQLKNN